MSLFDMAVDVEVVETYLIFIYNQRRIGTIEAQRDIA